MDANEGLPRIFLFTKLVRTRLGMRRSVHSMFTAFCCFGTPDDRNWCYCFRRPSISFKHPTFPHACTCSPFASIPVPAVVRTSPFPNTKHFQKPLNAFFRTFQA